MIDLESARPQDPAGSYRFWPDAGENSLVAGTTLGPYVVADLIGMGGMGEVYRALDPRLDRHVAIKILRFRFADDPDLRLRFERETRILSALAHKNICTVFDTGTHAGQSFIVMELLEGRTLEDALRDGPMPLGQLLDVAIQVADALRSAHQRGLVHRDIKSANIFLTSRGDAKVLDFGIAKSHAEISGDHPPGAMTRDGEVIGTVAFMSPEQARGEPLDVRSDLFSFGIVLFHMATGCVPYSGAPVATLARIATPLPVPRIRESNRALPRALDSIVARALAKDREARYASAAEMLDDLRKLRSGVTSGRVRAVGGDSVFSRVADALRSRWALAAAAVLVLGAAGAWMARRAPVGEAPIRSLLALDCRDASTSPSVAYQCQVIAANIAAALDSIPSLALRIGESPSPEETADPALAGRREGTDAVLVTQLDSGAGGWLARVLLTESRSGNILWSHPYSVGAHEVSTLPGRIASDAVNEVARRGLAGSSSAASNALALRQAEYQMSRRTSESLERAVSLYRSVIARDSTVARAWAGLAMARLLQSYYSATDADAAQRDAITAARRALDLDAGLSDAHAALGLALRDHDWDWAEAEIELRTAAELDTASAPALQWYAELLHMTGRSSMAEPMLAAALRLRPLELTPRAVRGWILLSTGRADEAIRVLRATLEMSRDHHLSQYFLGAALLTKGDASAAIEPMRLAVALAPETRFYRAGLGHVLARAGRREEAQRLLDELRASGGAGQVSPYDIAILLVGLGDRDGAIHELERAVRERHRDVVNIKVDPLLAPLRDDPRFASLVRRAGLPADS